MNSWIFRDFGVGPVLKVVYTQEYNDPLQRRGHRLRPLGPKGQIFTFFAQKPSLLSLYPYLGPRETRKMPILPTSNIAPPLTPSGIYLLKFILSIEIIIISSSNLLFYLLLIWESIDTPNLNYLCIICVKYILN